MYISELKIANFRQIRDVNIGPIQEPVDLGEIIVLAGPNGSGKSSVLELLSYGIASRYSWQYYQSRQITEHSFAVRIGLTETELQQLENAQAEKGQASQEAPQRERKSRGPTDQEAVQYARENRGYWMEVNMPDAFDQTNAEVNERVHGLVSREFQNFTKKLGFFLRADRGYKAKGYDRRHLFNYKNRLSPQHVGSISYGEASTQYEDMYDFLVEQSYHYIYNLGLYYKNLENGTPGEKPDDPLQSYNELLGKLFPGYSFVEATADNLSLRIKLPTENILPFEDLSSGEKEIFFILYCLSLSVMTYLSRS